MFRAYISIVSNYLFLFTVLCSAEFGSNPKIVAVLTLKHYSLMHHSPLPQICFYIHMVDCGRQWESKKKVGAPNSFFIVLSLLENVKSVSHVRWNLNQDIIMSSILGYVYYLGSWKATQRFWKWTLSDYMFFFYSFRVTVSSQASLQTSIAPRPRLRLRKHLPPASLRSHLSKLCRSKDLQPTSSSACRLRVTFCWAPWGSISPGICPCMAGGWAPRSSSSSSSPPRPAWGPSTTMQ